MHKSDCFSKRMKTKILWCRVAVTLSCLSLVYVSSIANQTSHSVFLVGAVVALFLIFVGPYVCSVNPFVLHAMSNKVLMVLSNKPFETCIVSMAWSIYNSFQ
jgi:hypothetical protein